MASPLLLSISTPFRLSSPHRFPSPCNGATHSLRRSPPLSFPQPSQTPHLRWPFPCGSRRFVASIRAGGTSIGGAESENPLPDEAPVGEDSAVFELREQKLSSWVYFTAILGVVLGALNILWISPSTGFGAAYIDAVSGLSERPEVTMYTKYPTYKD